MTLIKVNEQNYETIVKGPANINKKLKRLWLHSKSSQIPWAKKQPKETRQTPVFFS